MRKIYKYPLKDNERVAIIGQFESFLELHYQNDVPTLWAIVNDELAEVPYIITVQTTGFELEDSEGMRNYLGTLESKDGFVLHYFFRRANEFDLDDNDDLLKAIRNIPERSEMS